MLALALRKAAGTEVRTRSQAIVATPGIIWASDNDKGRLGLRGGILKFWQTLHFQFFPWSFFWISSYLNTAKKKKKRSDCVLWVPAPVHSRK